MASNRLVILALFLPGLAVTLRGMTLGELSPAASVR
jgi:hypothetical protein